MSELSAWREQRRQDRLADREQDRIDKSQAAAERREARRLEREQDREDRAAARAEERQDKATRSERRRAARAWIVENGALICTALVMSCAIVPALAAQVVALTTAGLGALFAVLLASMFEGAAWAATFGAAQAARHGQPTARYRAATWGCALVAGAVNFWHGSHDYGLWLGVVLAAASLFAVGMWELHLHGAHAPTADERERSRHARRRRRHHWKVCRTADRLITAAPYGALPAEAAFISAWQVRHGTRPGLTAGLLGARLAAEAGIGQVVESATDSHPQRVTARLWTSTDDVLPVLGAISPIDLSKHQKTSRSVANQSRGDQQESIPDRLAGSADPSPDPVPAPTPIRSLRAPRRATGSVPPSARTLRPVRTDDELLAEARDLTARWPREEVSAEGIRRALRVAPAKARWLRDRLKADRQAAAAPAPALRK
ncbi:DUF2637 domain-containing protein [Streptomyces roseoverticillatus]|uniref:DUF2637 domain-containing protein n=1 Tax=Streptomyces roseoverticillatus TaxID=66429 RepID=UPI0004BF9633|nr:DUF2637 domain-containing protein [Streptomyces roseoverticillatus]